MPKKVSRAADVDQIRLPLMIDSRTHFGGQWLRSNPVPVCYLAVESLRHLNCKESLTSLVWASWCFTTIEITSKGRSRMVLHQTCRTIVANWRAVFLSTRPACLDAWKLFHVFGSPFKWLVISAAMRSICVEPSRQTSTLRGIFRLKQSIRS